MVEQKQTKEKMEEKKETKPVEKETVVPKEETKKVEKIDKKKVQEIKTKDKAVVRGQSVRASAKTSVAICKMIKHRTIENALADLSLVLRGKKVVRMHSAEVGHKPGARTAGGKYPVNTTKVFMDLLKQLKANAAVAGVENPIITIAKADRAPRPFRRDGTKGKRAHIYIEVMDQTKLKIKERK